MGCGVLVKVASGRLPPIMTAAAGTTSHAIKLLSQGPVRQVFWAGLHLPGGTHLGHGNPDQHFEQAVCDRGLLYHATILHTVPVSHATNLVSWGPVGKPS